VIEQEVLKLLAGDAEILQRVTSQAHGERLYIGRIPQGVEVPAVVAKKIGRSEHYGLEGREDSFLTTIQIDTYDQTPALADSLAELVATKLVGPPGGSDYRGSAGDHEIESIECTNIRSEHQKPTNASDNWRPRDSRDYRFHHS